MRDNDVNHSNNELELALQPLAGCLRFSHQFSRSWDMGIGMSVGPICGVTIKSGINEEIEEWATAGVSIQYHLSDALMLRAGPVGTTLVTGNDWGTIYPSASLGLGFALGRVRVVSDLQVIRIAGGYSTGRYRILWIPVRVGIPFTF